MLHIYFHPVEKFGFNITMYSCHAIVSSKAEYIAIQCNVSIADILYSGQLSMVNTILETDYQFSNKRYFSMVETFI